MTRTDMELAAWLATIEDEDEREAVAAAFAIASQSAVEDDADEVFTPFVYPH